MKYFIPALLFCITVVSCNNTSKSPGASAVCYSGKLVKKGICGYLVVEMISPAVSEVKMERAWRDSFSSKDYKNVFTVGNPCQFPEAINQDEEFLFEITTNVQQDCMRCEAYTPVPETQNMILVCKK